MMDSNHSCGEREPASARRFAFETDAISRPDDFLSRLARKSSRPSACSDESGRVVAHFTLYNVISWQIVLAEAGGTPNARIALISNPLAPAEWSDTIADEIDIDFAWLDSPDYPDEFKRARERLEATLRHKAETQRTRELNRIAADVFEKHGIVDEHEPIAQIYLSGVIFFITASPSSLACSSRAAICFFTYSV
jgi:hypothetical protein